MVKEYSRMAAAAEPKSVVEADECGGDSRKQNSYLAGTLNSGNNCLHNAS